MKNPKFQRSLFTFTFTFNVPGTLSLRLIEFHTILGGKLAYGS
jgi:hypothetical protein